MRCLTLSEIPDHQVFTWFCRRSNERPEMDNECHEFPESTFKDGNEMDRLAETTPQKNAGVGDGLATRCMTQSKVRPLQNQMRCFLHASPGTQHANWYGVSSTRRLPITFCNPSSTTCQRFGLGPSISAWTTIPTGNWRAGTWLNTAITCSTLNVQQSVSGKEEAKAV